MTRSSLRNILGGLLLLTGLGITACSAPNPQGFHHPPRLLFEEALSLENQNLYSEAITKYEKLISENPGTRLATFAYLKMADIYSRQKEWVKAETNYRLFLNLFANSHLTPHVIYSLLKVNHQKSYTGVFFREREIDRDMTPNRQIILEYKRFFLLYPKSVYLKEITPIYRDARETLAMHEELVADFYFRRELFNAAIGRYQYLLRNYPEFKGTRNVLGKLIRSYKENQQPVQAREMERIFKLRFVVSTPERSAEEPTQ